MSPLHDNSGEYRITYLETEWFSQLGDEQNGLRLTAGAREFSLRLRTQISPEAHPICYLVDTEAFPPRTRWDLLLISN
jgi:hypothetical protein